MDALCEHSLVHLRLDEKLPNTHTELGRLSKTDLRLLGSYVPHDSLLGSRLSEIYQSIAKYSASAGESKGLTSKAHNSIMCLGGILLTRSHN